jgi:hypothetical protein
VGTIGLLFAASVFVMSVDKDKREIERTMQQGILETSSYPEIVYECSSLAVTKASEGSIRLHSMVN